MCYLSISPLTKIIIKFPFFLSMFISLMLCFKPSHCCCGRTKKEKISGAANDPWMNRSMMINLKIIIFIFISKSPDIFMLYCRKNHATHHVWYRNTSTHIHPDIRTLFHKLVKELKVSSFPLFPVKKCLTSIFHH